MKKLGLLFTFCFVVSYAQADNIFDSVTIENEKIKEIVTSNASYTQKLAKLSDLVDLDLRDGICEKKKQKAKKIKDFLQALQQTDLEKDGLINTTKVQELLSPYIIPDAFDSGRQRLALLMSMCASMMLQPRNGTVSARDIHTYQKDNFYRCAVYSDQAPGVCGIAQDENAKKASALCMQLQKDFWKTFIKALQEHFEKHPGVEQPTDELRKMFFSQLIDTCIAHLNKIRNSDELLFIQLFIPQEILAEIDQRVISIAAEGIDDNPSLGGWLLMDLGMEYPEEDSNAPVAEREKAFFENQEWINEFIEKFVDYQYGRVFRKYGLLQD